MAHLFSFSNGPLVMGHFSAEIDLEMPKSPIYAVQEGKWVILAFSH